MFSDTIVDIHRCSKCGANDVDSPVHEFWDGHFYCESCLETACTGLVEYLRTHPVFAEVVAPRTVLSPMTWRVIQWTCRAVYAMVVCLILFFLGSLALDLGDDPENWRYVLIVWLQMALILNSLIIAAQKSPFVPDLWPFQETLVTLKNGQIHGVCRKPQAISRCKLSLWDNYRGVLLVGNRRRFLVELGRTEPAHTLWRAIMVLRGDGAVESPLCLPSHHEGVTNLAESC